MAFDLGVRCFDLGVRCGLGVRAAFGVLIPPAATEAANVSAGGGLFNSARSGFGNAARPLRNPASTTTRIPDTEAFTRVPAGCWAVRYLGGSQSSTPAGGFPCLYSALMRFVSRPRYFFIVEMQYGWQLPPPLRSASHMPSRDSEAAISSSVSRNPASNPAIRARAQIRPRTLNMSWSASKPASTWMLTSAAAPPSLSRYSRARRRRSSRSLACASSSSSRCSSVFAASAAAAAASRAAFSSRTAGEGGGESLYMKKWAKRGSVSLLRERRSVPTRRRRAFRFPA
mmetsp:Transcript_15332/g.37651  ORF Transcript_15332/g.37651 Transcript_15332/m.37651 type:complete len:285 (+) Transcript_15332:421-1275(+)